MTGEAERNMRQVPLEGDPWEETLEGTQREREIENHILTANLSDARVSAFREGYIADRARANTLETLFRAAGAFREETEWNDAVAFGFTVLLQKGPFVERANWFPYRTWEFALATERHLLNRLGELLLNRRRLQIPVPRSWETLIAQAQMLAMQVRQAHPPVIVLTGPFSGEELVRFGEHAAPEWELPDELHRPWILGAVQDMPVLHLRNRPESALYAVDLGRFATLTKFGNDIQFSLESLTEERAREMLARRPELIPDPPPGTGNEAERLRRLQLKVGLRLYESYQLDVNDTAAATGQAVAAPMG